MGLLLALVARLTLPRRRIRPTKLSLARRKKVIEYVSSVIQACFGPEVGSLPWELCHQQQLSGTHGRSSAARKRPVQRAPRREAALHCPKARRCRLLCILRSATQAHVWLLASADVLTPHMWLAVQVEAIPFGSVPLNTYLPDGDIDLSIYSHSQPAAAKEALRESWASQLQQYLGREAHRPYAPFPVDNVQIIHAEVRDGEHAHSCRLAPQAPHSRRLRQFVRGQQAARPRPLCARRARAGTRLATHAHPQPPARTRIPRPSIVQSGLEARPAGCALARMRVPGQAAQVPRGQHRGRHLVLPGRARRQWPPEAVTRAARRLYGC
jgi:hypothetical protein